MSRVKAFDTEDRTRVDYRNLGTGSFKASIGLFVALPMVTNLRLLTAYLPGF